VYGPRNLNEALIVAAKGQIEHHLEKLVKDGKAEALKTDTQVYKIIR